MITWKDEYMIGHSEIDQQHQKLFEIASQIYTLLKSEMLLDKYDRVTELISELVDYTGYHFEFEENYMNSIGYKKILSHKVEHKDFVEKINSADIDSLDQNQDAFLLELLDFVVVWIRDHILNRDKLINAE